MSTQAFPVWLIILILASLFCAGALATVEPVIAVVKAKAKAPQGARGDSARPAGDDDFTGDTEQADDHGFAYDEQKGFVADRATVPRLTMT